MKIKLLKERNFLLLMQGTFVSLLGSYMQTFALSLYVLNTYKSTTLFASVLITAAIPRLVLGPFAGVFVDWYDRKKLIVRLDLLSSAVMTVFTVYYFATGTLPLWVIYTLTIGLSLIGTLFSPAAGTILPSILKKEDLLEGNSIANIVRTSAGIVSPLVAGALMGLWGMGVILTVNAISFFLSAISELFITLPFKAPKHESLNLSTYKADFKEGFTYLFSNPFTRNLIIFAFVANFTIGPTFSIAIPHILKKEFLISDMEFGIFESILVGASLAASVLAMTIGKKIKLGNMLKISVYTQILSTGIIGVIALPFLVNFMGNIFWPYALILLFAFITITCIAMANIAVGTKIQTEVPNELLGRIGTVSDSINSASVPLGQAIFGLCLDFSIASVVLIGASVFGLIASNIYIKGLTTEQAPVYDEDVRVV